MSESEHAFLARIPEPTLDWLEFASHPAEWLREVAVELMPKGEKTR